MNNKTAKSNACLRLARWRHGIFYELQSDAPISQTSYATASALLHYRWACGRHLPGKNTDFPFTESEKIDLLFASCTAMNSYKSL